MSDTNYGLWLVTSFGATVMVVFGYPSNEFAQPKNIFFGHLLTSFIGILFVNYISLPIFINLALAVGFGVFFMIIFNVVHPPAGGNPIIAIRRFAMSPVFISWNISSGVAELPIALAMLGVCSTATKRCSIPNRRSFNGSTAADIPTFVSRNISCFRI